MSLRSISTMLVSLALFACSSLFAAPLLVDVAGIQSNGLFGDSGNTVLSIEVGVNPATRGPVPAATPMPST